MGGEGMIESSNSRVRVTMETAKNGKVLLRVRPRGFCAGVVRAVDIVELALEAYGAPVYVHHEIVHNTYVVEQLRRRGAIFVESIEDVPHGAVLVFSAHGVPPTVRDEAKARSLKVIDATCPLVTKVHLEALKFAREKRTIILIGHKRPPGNCGDVGRSSGPHHCGGFGGGGGFAGSGRSGQIVVSDADDVESLRYAGNCGALAAEVSGDQGTGQRRHLLCHAKSAGSGGAGGQGRGVDSGGGLAEQFEFEPAGGSGAAQRSAGAVDRFGGGHRCAAGSKAWSAWG